MSREISVLMAIVALPSSGLDDFRVTQCLLGGAAVGVLWGILQTDPPKDSQLAERKWLKGARSICGFMGGVCLPYLGNHKAWWSLVSFHPALLVGFGFLCAALSYFLLHTILKLIGKKQNFLAARGLSKMLDRADRDFKPERQGEDDES